MVNGRYGWRPAPPPGCRRSSTIWGTSRAWWRGPAQPSHQRDRDHRPRPRAVLRRVAQGGGQGHSLHRLRVDRARRGRARRSTGRLGTPYLSRLNGTLADGTLLVTPTVVDVARSLSSSSIPTPALTPRCRRSPHRTWRSDDGYGLSDRAGPIDGSGSSPAAPTWSRPVSANRGTSRRWSGPGSSSTPDWSVSASTPARRRRPARELLEMSDPPTAIFAANDVSAIATMDVAHSPGSRCRTTCR